MSDAVRTYGRDGSTTRSHLAGSPDSASRSGQALSTPRHGLPSLGISVRHDSGAEGPNLVEDLQPTELEVLGASISCLVDIKARAAHQRISALPATGTVALVAPEYALQRVWAY